jgi:DNA topoisomerase-3
MLSESALITKMDQNGIGTDATIHEHINKIKYRGYAIKEFNQFKPTPIGLHLIESYTKLGLKLEKPDLRAEMERDMKAIERGEASRDESKSDDYTNTNTYSGR